MEAVWNLLKSRHVNIEPKIEAFSILLDNDRNVIIRNPADTELPNDYPLIRYLKCPDAFISLSTGLFRNREILQPNAGIHPRKIRK